MVEYATGKLSCLFFYSIHPPLPKTLLWAWISRQQVTWNLMTALQKHDANHFTKKSCMLKRTVLLSTKGENHRISVNFHRLTDLATGWIHPRQMHTSCLHQQVQVCQQMSPGWTSFALMLRFQSSSNPQHLQK